MAQSLEQLFPGKRFINTVLEALETKTDMSGSLTLRYLMRAAMAGMIVAVLYVVNYEVTAVFSKIPVGETDLTGIGKLLGAFCFGWALVFIYYTRSELLTSNMMVVVTGLYYKRTSFGRCARVLTYCFLGNFIGGFILAILFSFSSLVGGRTGELMAHAAEVKIAYTQTLAGCGDLMVRAILCNFMINLAMLLIYNGFIHEDVAKISAMVVSVFIFAFLGFEHSVANTVLFTVVGFTHGVHVTGAILNVLLVLIGNFIGGGILIGLYYAYMNDDSRFVKQGRDAAEFTAREKVEK